MQRGEGQGKGFQPVSQDSYVVTYTLATGSGCSAGDALTNTASQAGHLIQATASSICIYAVAVETVASSASGYPSVRCVSLHNNPQFRVKCDAAPTASNLLQFCALDNAYTLDPSDTASTTGQVFFLEATDYRGTAVGIGRFVKTPYTRNAGT